MSKGIGTLQKKILLILDAGIGFSFAYNQSRRRWIYKKLARELEKVDRKALKAAIENLYVSKTIGYREDKNGLITLVLLKKGRRKTLSYRLEEMRIKKPAQWDKQWRIVVFDIPHDIRQVRDAFREHLKRLGFKELQESVWIFPYPCCDEIEFLVEFYDIRLYVRQIVAASVDNELHLREMFNLLQ